MVDKLEYDSALGGSVNVPDSIRTFHFAAKRLVEMKLMLRDIQNPSNNKLAFQSLPKHMRRRAMSHHPKRLPRPYRSIHKGQMIKAGNPKTSKRPSRKYRRKSSNLLKEYRRRQRVNIWLETHIWHAKRFHMIPKWGYKLPYSSCNKMYRACYRATSKHCLLHDISYFACIEIKGPIETIKAGFSRLTSSKVGLGIAAKTYVSGKREGKVTIFKADRYPKDALCTASFLWKPEEISICTQRTLWLFVHPSAYRETLKEIVTLFHLTSTNKHLNIDKYSSSEKTENSMQKHDECKIAHVLTNNETKIILTELKDTMNRFCLTGPLSHAILFQALKCVKIDQERQLSWFQDFVASQNYAQAHQKQEEFWEECKTISSPSVLLPNMIIGLNVEDPRVNRPDKRSKAKSENSDTNTRSFLEIPLELCYSAIWNPEIREKISESKMSDHEFCSARSKNAIVPGGRCKFEDELQPVPVLLIQRPGAQYHLHRRLGYGSGWDIIVPAGYGISLWLCLIMWGAKPGGLREMKSIYSELGEEEFMPDTISGRKDSEERYAVLRKKYFLTPPNKRCNYQKLGISSPFRCSFQQLIQEWDENNTCNDFYVLRERETLRAVDNAINGQSDLPFLPNNCLVPVCLKLKSRGNPGDYAIICLPTRRDIKHNLIKRKFLNNEPIYVEPVHPDETEKERRSLRIEHQKQLKRLRGKRSRDRKASQRFSHHTRIIESKPLVIAHLKKMKELWLPENIRTIRNQCSREVFGYVTQSRFNFTEAMVTAIGFITPPGLRKLFKLCGKGEKVVLLRGTKGRNYRFASLKLNQ